MGVRYTDCSRQPCIVSGSCEMRQSFAIIELADDRLHPVTQYTVRREPRNVVYCSLTVVNDSLAAYLQRLRTPTTFSYRLGPRKAAVRRVNRQTLRQ